MELDLWLSSLLRAEYLKQRCSLAYAGELDAKCLNFNKKVLGCASFRQETATDKTGLVLIDERGWNGGRKKQVH